MRYSPYDLARRVPGLPARLDDLAARLRALAARVRLAATEAAGDLAAGAVTDALARLWGGGLAAAGPRRDDYRWPGDDHGGPWYDEPHEWDEPAPADVPPADGPNARTRLLGLALQGAGWWLYRRGGWAGAWASGLLAGGLLLLGGRYVLAGLGLAESAGELLALDRLLAPGPRAGGAD
jgi:hypothetical protein